jgi:signal peptidase
MWVFIQTKVNPNKIPSIFGYKPFIVLSGSMESQLYRGDLAIVKNVDVNTLKENDIVAFRDHDNYVVTHRIISVVNGEFITKGDNNASADSDTVSKGDIEGLYVYKISGLGNILLVMQKPITLGIILAIIVVGGIFWFVLDNNKLTLDERKELEELRKEREKNN